MKNLIRITALCLMFVPSFACAQDLDKGYNAYDSSDYATSLKEFKPLAEQGNAEAQLMLGIMYENGKGVLQDYAEAAKWYTKASEQGDAPAQYNLGRMYEYGQGVAQDYAEAVRLYKKAAEQGFALAQNNLGVKYSYGEGVPLDFIAAHMWYNIASVNGDERAVKNRDLVATNMTPADISEAQRRANVCMSSGYADCD